MCTMEVSSVLRESPNNFLPFLPSRKRNRETRKACEYCAKRERRPPAKSYLSLTVGTNGQTAGRAISELTLNTRIILTRKKLANMILSLNHATRRVCQIKAKDSLITSTPAPKNYPVGQINEVRGCPRGARVWEARDQPLPSFISPAEYFVDRKGLSSNVVCESHV